MDCTFGSTKLLCCIHEMAVAYMNTILYHPKRMNLKSYKFNLQITKPWMSGNMSQTDEDSLYIIERNEDTTGYLREMPLAIMQMYSVRTSNSYLITQ